MTHDPPDYPHCSPAARSVFAHIHHHGGTMRMGPFLRGFHMQQAPLVDAINELVERCWMKIVWRKSPNFTPGEESRPVTDAERLVTTRWGRHRYGSTWSA